MEDLSTSVSLSCCVADVRETTASLFAKTPDVRHQAIASPDAGSKREKQVERRRLQLRHSVSSSGSLGWKSLAGT
jgi:hypothetical protein